MKKIAIIGCPGSGKSYLAKRLNKILNINVYYLDMLYWKENWDHVKKDDLRIKVKSIMINNDCWIIDGNYSYSLEDRFIYADTIIFLDIRLSTCLNGVRKRRNKKRDDFPEFLYEEEDEEFITYIKNFKNNERNIILELIEKYKNKNIIILKTRKEINSFINELKRKNCP